MNTKNYLESTESHFEFQWNVFQGHTTMELPKEIQMKMATRGIRPEEFEDPIIFMSMFNDIDWTKKGNSNDFSDSVNVSDYAKRFQKGHCPLLGPDDEEK